MTKAKISEYDAVAANNTDVNGVNIAEGCPPSSMNNMGREIMAALKRFQTGADGDSVTVGGGLSVDGAVVFNDAGADVDFRVEGDTNANLLFVDASTDRVGIGTNSPSYLLHLAASSATDGPQIRLQNTSTGINTGGTAGVIDFYANDASSGGTGISGFIKNVFINSGVASALTFGTRSSGDAVERLRIDSAGSLFVGKTALNDTEVGFALAGTGNPSTGIAYFATDGGISMSLNRLTSDGDILRFRKDGTTEGSIGIDTGNLYITGDGAKSGITFGTVTWQPMYNETTADNTIDLGSLTLRFDDLYATNGTIQTSDRNEKQDIEELSEAETRVAVAAKALMRKYRWKSAVAEKGDDARIHFGIIAQDLKAAFEAEGLDAGRYAMFIHSAWWEKERIIPAVEGKEAVLDDEGNVVEEAVEAQPERTVIDTFETEEAGAVRKERMGIRYNELLAFIIAAI